MRKTFDGERADFDLVTYESHGMTFELVVDPDKAIAYKKKGKDSKDEIRSMVRAENIFYDAKKGNIAGEADLEKVFGSTNFFDVAQKIIEKGKIQLTEQYRKRLREKKKKKIIDLIHKMSINPRNNTPIPKKRIKNGMREANVKIDNFTSAEDQVKGIVDTLKPLMPIKVENRTLEIELSMEQGSKLYGMIKNYGDVHEENWTDTGYECRIEIPAGQTDELIEKLNDRTKGEAKIKIINE